MKKHLTLTKLSIANLLLMYAFVVLLIFGCSPADDKLIIATAANSQFAFEKIATDFQNDTGIEVELVISASGKHTAQIIAGAPYDIFISADMKYPEKLFKDNLTTQAPSVYAYGQLVLWSIAETRFSNIEDLDKSEIRHIAIPNPKTAPYGVAAKEALIKLNHWDLLASRLVYGESVAQTNQYIVSGAAEVGFTAASIVMAPRNKEIGQWVLIPDSLYSPMAQGAVILKNSNKIEMAQKFYQYLLSDESKQTLRSFGYKTIPE